MQKLTAKITTMAMAGFLLWGHAGLAAVVTNDSFFAEQWYLQKIKADEAWLSTQGSSEVVVAVLDSGVDIDHSDLRANIWTNTGEIPDDGIDNDGNGFADDAHGWDFVEDVPDPRPKLEDGLTEVGFYHGTAIASIIAAEGNNFKGLTGVTWRSRIMPVRVVDASGNGTEENVIKGIRYAIRNGAHVINMSFVGPDKKADFLVALEEAYDAGVVVVAAAGNENSNGLHGSDLDALAAYPVCYDVQGKNLVLGIAATDENDRKGDFSNYGAECVDLSAPGADFVVATPGIAELNVRPGYITNWSGTSLAAPLVSGAAALLKSKFRDLTVAKIQELILSNADPIDALNAGYAGKLGIGRLNVAKIFESVEAQDVAPSSSETQNFASLRSGDLIKASGTAVYRYAGGKRYVFPNEKIFFTWHSDFSNLVTLTDEALAAIPIGGNMTYRPGSRLIKFSTDPNVYAVEDGGVLRLIESEAVAAELFGSDWAALVDDVPETFFADYHLQEM